MILRAFLGLSLVLVCSAWCAAEVRTWTDQQGRTMRGEFVRVHEGRVVLKSGSQTQMVPLSQLSQQDRDYIESQLNRKARKDGDDDGQPVRIWTDARGNQIPASFLRMNDKQVVLSESGKPRLIAFMELSEQDRKHVKDLLRTQGDELQAAALERHEEEVAKAAAAAREAAARAAAPPAPTTPPPSPFAQQMQEHQERMRQQEEQRRQQDEQRRQEAAQRQAQYEAERQQRMQEQQQRMQEQQERWKQQQQQAAEQSRQTYERLTQMSSGPSMVTEYICSNCRKSIPASIGAGGHCPHCGVYFAYSETPGGQRTYASGGGGSDWSNFHISGRGIKGLIGIIVFLGGGVAALWRKFAG